MSKMLELTRDEINVISKMEINSDERRIRENKKIRFFLFYIMLGTGGTFWNNEDDVDIQKTVRMFLEFQKILLVSQTLQRPIGDHLQTAMSDRRPIVISRKTTFFQQYFTPHLTLIFWIVLMVKHICLHKYPYFLILFLQFKVIKSAFFIYCPAWL